MIYTPDFLILFHRSLRALFIFNSLIPVSVRIISTELPPNLLMTLVLVLKMLLISNELFILDVFLVLEFILYRFHLSPENVQSFYFFSSKSFNIFIISILKGLTANSNICPIHRSASVDAFSLDFRLHFRTSPYRSYGSLSFGFVRDFIWFLPLVLGQPLVRTQSFCSFSPKCEVFSNPPIRQDLRSKLNTTPAEILAQFFSPSNATFCLVS